MTQSLRNCKHVVNHFKTRFQNTFCVKNGISLSVSNLNQVCWKCGVIKKHPDIFCEKCHIIQNPHEKQNYYKVLEIDEKFDIDTKLLKERFRKLQSLLHPDKFSNKSSQEKTISEEYSSLLNKAYSTLQVPLKRAEHLLSLRGEHIEESETGNSEFLLEIMELNEQVEDAGSDVRKLKQICKNNEEHLHELEKNINHCFQCNNIGKVKEYVIKLKYFTNVNKRINNLLRELGEAD